MSKLELYSNFDKVKVLYKKNVGDNTRFEIEYVKICLGNLSSRNMGADFLQDQYLETYLRSDMNLGLSKNANAFCFLNPFFD